jgi:hypothetical protein
LKLVIPEALVASARRGDRRRFDQLFDIWLDAVYAMTLRSVDGDRVRAQPLMRRLLLDCVRTESATPAAPVARESTNDGRGVV